MIRPSEIQADFCSLSCPSCVWTLFPGGCSPSSSQTERRGYQPVVFQIIFLGLLQDREAFVLSHSSGTSLIHRSLSKIITVAWQWPRSAPSGFMDAACGGLQSKTLRNNEKTLESCPSWLSDVFLHRLHICYTRSYSLSRLQDKTRVTFSCELFQVLMHLLCSELLHLEYEENL